MKKKKKKNEKKEKNEKKRKKRFFYIYLYRILCYCHAIDDRALPLETAWPCWRTHDFQVQSAGWGFISFNVSIFWVFFTSLGDDTYLFLVCGSSWPCAQDRLPARARVSLSPGIVLIPCNPFRQTQNSLSLWWNRPCARRHAARIHLLNSQLCPPLQSTSLPFNRAPIQTRYARPFFCSKRMLVVIFYYYWRRFIFGCAVESAARECNTTSNFQNWYDVPRP